MDKSPPSIKKQVFFVKNKYKSEQMNNFLIVFICSSNLGLDQIWDWNYLNERYVISASFSLSMRTVITFFVGRPTFAYVDDKPKGTHFCHRSIVRSIRSDFVVITTSNHTNQENAPHPLFFKSYFVTYFHLRLSCSQ